MKEQLSIGLTALEEGLDTIKNHLGRRLGSPEPVMILPYRGYGTTERVWLRGRVLEDEGVTGVADEDESLLDRVTTMLRRYESDEIPDAQVVASFAGREIELRTDEEGYFELELDGLDASDVTSPWTSVELELCSHLREGQSTVRSTGRVRVPGSSARRAIVSDMDDTVVKTGATDLLRHTRTVLTNNARSREPFPGVSSLYRALEAGPGGAEQNPFFYVSSSPWNLYDLFESFLELHDIPLGPIFLKDFGIDRGKLLKSGHVDYKADRMARILDAYPGLEVVLLGDSGQQDAFVFEQVVERYGERVLACYLRDLDPDDPDPEIEDVEDRVASQGVPMLRVADSAAAAEHAAEHGWIAREAVDAVRRAVREAGEDDAGE